MGDTSTQMVIDRLETVGGECLCYGLSVGAVLSTWQCVLFSYDYISKSNESVIYFWTSSILYLLFYE